MIKKAVFITGAGSGIGKALAIESAKRGYSLAIMGRNLKTLEITASDCAIYDVSISIHVGDVSSENDCKKAINEAIANHGNLYCLFNNAGISMRALFAEVDLTVLKQVMDTNFWGTVYCTKYALPEILKNKGSIVGVSSIAGFKGLPGRTGYSASKFAMHGFLEALRCENLKKNLHVMIACPGFTDSNIRKTALNALGQTQSESPLDEKSLMPASKVAYEIWEALMQKRWYLVLTVQGKMAVFLNKWFPRLADKLTYRKMSKEPNSPFS